jgi:AcrR family transcriptional regulator
MAREPRRRRSTRTRIVPSGPARAVPPKERIVDALMALAAERDYGAIGLGDIAEKAGVTLANLRDFYGSKGAILADFVRRIDQAALEKGTPEGSEERDRLFDVMMRRFDALVPYRAAVKRIASAACRDPVLARRLHRLGRRSQMWMLEAAGIHKRGIARGIAIEGAVLVHADAMRAFLDDGPDLSKTMAALDRGLTRGERAMQWVDRGCALLCDVRERLRSFRGRAAA